MHLTKGPGFGLCKYSPSQATRCCGSNINTHSLLMGPVTSQNTFAHPCRAAGSTGNQQSYNSHCHHSPRTSSVSTFNQCNRNKHLLQTGNVQWGTWFCLAQNTKPSDCLHLWEPEGKALTRMGLLGWTLFPNGVSFPFRVNLCSEVHLSMTLFSHWLFKASLPSGHPALPSQAPR